MLERAAHDQIALRMRGQPRTGTRQQLVDLGIVHPVMLGIVEDRDQHGELPENITKPRRDAEAQIEHRAQSRLAQRKRLHRVTKRREDPRDQIGIAMHRKRHDPDLEGQRAHGEFGPLPRAPGKRLADAPPQRHAQQRIRGIGPVVDVLRQKPFAAAAPRPGTRPRLSAHQRHGIDGVMHDGTGLRVVPLREEDRQRARADITHMDAIGMLVQQMSEITGAVIAPRRRPQCDFDLHDIHEMFTPHIDTRRIAP